MRFVLLPPNIDFCPWLAESLVPSVLFANVVLKDEVFPPKVFPPEGDAPVPVLLENAEMVFVFPKRGLEGSLFCS